MVPPPTAIKGNNQVKCRVEALKEELKRTQERMLDVDNVRDYDNVRAKIAFLKDTLQRYDPVKEMPVKVVMYD